MYTAPVVKGCAEAAQAVASLAGTLYPLDEALTATNNAAEKTVTGLQKLNTAFTGYFMAAVGAASATAILVKSLQAYEAAQDEANNVGMQGRDSMGRANEIETIADAWDRFTTALDKVIVKVGETIARSSGLTAAINTMTAIVQNTAFVFNGIATVLGTVLGWMQSLGPVTVALAVAAKLVAVAIGVALHVAITRAIVGLITYLALGTAMTPMQLAWAAASMVSTVATSALTVAVWMLNAALGVLMSIGLPFWAAMAALLAVVVVAALALYAAWSYFSSPDELEQKNAELEKMGEKIKEVMGPAHDAMESLNKKIEQFGMSDMAKEAADFKEKLEGIRDIYGDTVADELLAEYEQRLAKLDALEKKEKAVKEEKEKQANVTKALRDIDNEWYARNLTDIEKKVLALRKVGANLEQIKIATEQLQEIEAQKKADDNKKKLAESIADIEKQAAEYGMTETEKRIAAAKALGAQEADILRIKKAGAEIEAREAGKKKADEVAKRVEQHTKEAQKMKELVEGPLGAYKKRMAEITELRKVGQISSDVANKAEALAAKELKEGLAKEGKVTAESPKALLKGSAEAELANDRAKAPIEKLTDIQKQALAEAKRMKQALDDINRKTDKAQAELVDF